VQVAATLTKNVLTPSNQEVKVLNVSEVRREMAAEGENGEG